MRTVEIPGGTAQLRDTREEIKIRQQRILDIVILPAIPAFEKVRAARDQFIAEGGKLDDWEKLAGTVKLSTLTRADSAAMMEYQDAQMIAVLHSWTLAQTLPTIDTIQDLDPDVYGALLTATRLLQNTTDVFDRDNMDPSPAEESPTGGSADSEPDSKSSKSAKSKATVPSLTASGSTDIENSTPD